MSSLWQQLELVSELECELEQEVAGSSLLSLSVRKTQLVLFSQSNKSGAFDAKLDATVLEEKPSVRGWDSFSAISLGLVLSYIISIASVKKGVLIYLMKFKFDKLLEDGSFSIHHRNIKTLPIEIFKFLN